MLGLFYSSKNNSLKNNASIFMPLKLKIKIGPNCAFQLFRQVSFHHACKNHIVGDWVGHFAIHGEFLIP